MTTLTAPPRTRPAPASSFARLALAALACLSALAVPVIASSPTAATGPAKAETAGVVTPEADVSSKLKPGERFRYSIRSRQVRQHQKPDESIVKWITRRTAVVSCEVLEPDPEIGPRVRVTFDEVGCTLLTPTKALRYSSRNTQNNIQGSAMTVAMDPIVGGQITLTLDQTGAIRRIEGTEKFLKEKELRKYAEHIVSDDAIVLLLGSIFRSIAQPSDGPDADAEPWANTRRLEFLEFATFVFDERWELNRRRNGKASFRIQSDVHAEFDERWPDAVLRDGRSVGSYTWDEASGRVYRTEINRFYTADLEGDPDGPSVAGEEVLTISAPLGDN